jgi:DNA polymerase III gamma/tau subunit
MSNNSLKDNLLRLWQENKLAHFYILQASPNEEAPREYLKDWVNAFMAKTISKDKSTDVDSAYETLKNGHGDILYVTKESANQNYSIKEDTFDEFFRFQNFSNIELRQRFIIVDDAHSITKILSNKLLKTLEEPAPNTTIFLLDPFRHEILPTISSRAIFLKIPSETVRKDRKKFDLFSKYLGHIEFDQEIINAVAQYEQNEEKISSILEAIKNNKEIEPDFVNSITDYVSHSSLSYESINEFMNSLKWYQKAKVFNNYSPEKITGLLQSVIH